MLPHRLTSFGIQKYDQDEPKFDGVCSRNELPKIKDQVYVINLDEYESIGTHLITLQVDDDSLTYLDSFEVVFKCIPEEI